MRSSKKGENEGEGGGGKKGSEGGRGGGRFDFDLFICHTLIQIQEAVVTSPLFQKRGIRVRADF